MAGAIRVVGRRARQAPRIEPERDPDRIVAYLEDASGHPAGHAAGVLRPDSTDHLSGWLRRTSGRGVSVLPQAARSSLTAGAVPRGDVVVSVERLREIGEVQARNGRGLVRVGAGVRLRELQSVLVAAGWYFPPVPTYQEAMVGGAVSTNAGGAATFKYGTMRSWVDGVTVVLADGTVLDVERGEAVAERGGAFEIVRPDGPSLHVPAPDWRLPELPKISAGYHSAPRVDLVDLFVGAEGTLGVVTAARLEVVPAPPSVLTAVAFVHSASAAIAMTDELRRGSTRGGPGDRAGADVRAVEYVDARGLSLLRAHGDLARVRVDVPRDAEAALLVEVELPSECSSERTLGELEAWSDGREPPEPGPLADALRALFAVLDRYDAIDSLQIAFPDDPPRRDALIAFREAVPTRVNEILAERRRSDAGVRKVGGDMIVPFGSVADMLGVYERGFVRRGLEWAVWGHLSDGNLHPNALARSTEEVRAGEDALLEFAERAVRLGGSPLSEHGVGRSPLKQEMLRRFLGEETVGRMRAIKRALDPESRLAPGVIFPAC